MSMKCSVHKARHGAARMGGIALATLGLAATSAHAVPYTLTELATLGGTHSWATGINDAGQVVGYSELGGGSSFVHATLWSNGTITDLSPGSSSSSYGYGINQTGQVAGTAANSIQPTLWNAGVPATLGTLGGTRGTASAINDAGQMVGTSSTVSNVNRATLWSAGTVTNLGALPGYSSSRAFAINATGQVVGDSLGSGQRPTLWSAGTIQDLGTLGGTTGAARAINNLGQVVGFSATAGTGGTHATLWSGGSVIDLGTLGGSSSFANGINDAGLVVGYSLIAGDASQRATVWMNGAVSDLNTLIDPAITNAGWMLNDAKDINNAGTIVGTMYNATTGTLRGFQMILSPVPEPSTYLLFAIGMLALWRLGATRRLAPAALV